MYYLIICQRDIRNTLFFALQRKKSESTSHLEKPKPLPSRNFLKYTQESTGIFEYYPGNQSYINIMQEHFFFRKTLKRLDLLSLLTQIRLEYILL